MPRRDSAQAGHEFCVGVGAKGKEGAQLRIFGYWAGAKGKIVWEKVEGSTGEWASGGGVGAEVRAREGAAD